MGTVREGLQENDTSGFKKRKVVRDDGTIGWIVIRPQFRQLLADLASGVIDGVIFHDLDRLLRQPRDLEDLIGIVKYVHRPGRQDPRRAGCRGRVCSASGPGLPAFAASGPRRVAARLAPVPYTWPPSARPSSPPSSPLPGPRSLPSPLLKAAVALLLILKVITPL
ncbi:recombinase family protein [Streptomyces fildesensis]|uniref:Recombinase family protein n=1 Tax=Streptomyces fildesensis TaxID=375757 RepID=A0ABW8C5X0_9ACTN